MTLAWGGVLNGQISLSQLHQAPNFNSLPGGFASASSGSNLMRADAATQLSGMMQEFFATFHTALTLSEGYRPLAIQRLYYTRYTSKAPGWTLAAYPGTSLHGYALSGDFAVLGGNPAGVHLAWLRANAAKYGFTNDVASEPWHWSYRTDLLTRTVVVQNYIDNPNAAAASAALASGGDMDIIIHNKKTGSMDWVNAAAGYLYHVPDDAYLALVRAANPGIQTIDLEDGQWGWYVDRLNDRNAAIAKRVWDEIIDNPAKGGKVPARSREAGIDQFKENVATISDAAVQKIVAAMPAGQGGSAAPIDQVALGQAVAKIVLDGFAGRMKE